MIVQIPIWVEEKKCIKVDFKCGNIRLTHRYLMAKDDKPMCNTCETELTVKLK